MEKIILLIVISLLASCQSPQQQIVATAVLSRLNVTSDEDCGGATYNGISIKGSNLTLTNCYSSPASGNGIDVRGSNITIKNVTVNSNIAEGTGINFDGVGSNVVVDGFHIYGNMGWGIAGSPNVIRNITIRNGLIEDVGKAGGAGKHGMYIGNWQNFLVEDVTILRSWNAGIKIVSETWDGVFNRVTVKDSGRSGDYGPAVSLGDQRISHIQRLTFSYCDFQNSISPAIWIIDYVNTPKNITVDHCYLKNNYIAVQLGKGATGWRVTNNVAWNEKSYQYSHVPLYFDGTTADVANNYFDYNNWWYDGANPIGVGSQSYSFAQWQAMASKPDMHGVSQLPGNTTATPTATRTANPPSITPSASRTPSPTATASATPTPTITATYTPTSTPTSTSTGEEPIIVVVAYRGEGKVLNMRISPSIYADVPGYLVPGARVTIVNVIPTTEIIYDVAKDEDVLWGNVYGEIAEGLYIPLLYQNRYFTDWRE